MGAFHLVKNSENSGSGLDGKRFFAARLPWAPSCSKKMAADPSKGKGLDDDDDDPGQVSGSFLQTNFRATTSALPATF